MAGRAGGLLLIVLGRAASLPFARFGDLSRIIIATAGLMFFWSQYSYLSGLSWWYGSVHHLRTGSAGRPGPDYDLATLPWKVAAARVFDVKPGRMTLVTSHDSFAYQASANIGTGGASAADIQFDVDVEAGGVTIGLVQGGKWVAISSSRRAGSFADWNSAQLGYRRSLTVVIANDNPAGESRFIVKSLRLYLRK
jgi:hypothetical protein